MDGKVTDFNSQKFSWRMIPAFLLPRGGDLMNKSGFYIIPNEVRFNK